MKMGYEKKWTVLANLLRELQKKGEKIPAEVIKDLRSAKTLMQVLKADPTHTENVSRIDEYMRNVESYLIFTAEKLETENVEMWLEQLKETKKVENYEKNEKSSTFILGVPRNKSWLRIKISDETKLDNVKKLAEESKIQYKNQKNGYVLVYGDEEKLKFFVKRMAEQFHGAKKEQM